jgi:hypothetical protein
MIHAWKILVDSVIEHRLWTLNKGEAWDQSLYPNDKQVGSYDGQTDYGQSRLRQNLRVKDLELEQLLIFNLLQVELRLFEPPLILIASKSVDSFKVGLGKVMEHHLFRNTFLSIVTHFWAGGRCTRCRCPGGPFRKNTVVSRHIDKAEIYHWTTLTVIFTANPINSGRINLSLGLTWSWGVSMWDVFGCIQFSRF